MENEEMKDKIRAKLDKVRTLKTERIVSETSNNHCGLISDFQIDYERILYSSSFRRLQGKMQMLGIENSNFYHNRLTHSLEVANVACRICNNLEKVYSNAPPNSTRQFWSFDELYLIRAICLAHDIGNPPFGHEGERILNHLAADFGGFEGNAQAFRIVTRFEQIFPNRDGLNLTKRTLLGLVKHFHSYSSGSDKFLYDEDYCEVQKILSDSDIKLEDGEQTIDSAVMDLADEIAYAAHDLSDALQQKYITADGLLYLFKKEANSPNVLRGKFERQEIEDAYTKLEALIKDARSYAEKEERGKSDDMYESLFRKRLSMLITDTLIEDVDYIAKKDNLGYKSLEALSAGLKKLLFEAIKSDTSMVIFYEKRGKVVLEGLFKVFSDSDFNKGNCLLSTPYRLGNNEMSRKRAVIDYISGMMDTFAIEQYDRFFGDGSSDVVYHPKK